jgi:hypothetical protein
MTRHTVRLAAGAWLALIGIGLPGCGSGHPPHLPVQRTPSPPSRLAGRGPIHIAVIVMENEEYGDIIGSSATPYLNGLARRYGLATESFAVRHPSLPNYLALTSGSTQGITDDCTDCRAGGRGLADQLQAGGISWRAYMEGLPHPCFTGSGAGDYAKKHDPFLYFPSISQNPSACAYVVPFDRLAADERSAAMPAFAWITPNLCHDMHDCSTATGDRFLARTVPALLSALGPRGLLFLTFDEGSSDDGCCRLAAGGHVATIVAGAGARPHSRLATPVDHYSILRTIEDLLGLPRLGGAACVCTPSLQPLIGR